MSSTNGYCSGWRVDELVDGDGEDQEEEERAEEKDCAEDDELVLM